MPANTPTFAWTYPAGGDPDDVPFYMQQLATQIDNTLGGAWATWTPTVANVTGTATGRYKKLGRTVHYRLDFLLSAAPTGSVTFTLPSAPITPPASVNPQLGIVHGKDISGGLYVQGMAIWSAGSTCRVMLSTSSANPQMSDMAAAVPFAWANGDFISISGTYEAAS